MSSPLKASLPSSRDEVEISRDEAIQMLLFDESISDFKLETLDGPVIANKSMLAARSPVFRRLIFHKKGAGVADVEEQTERDNNNNPGSQSVLKVDYSSQVMRAIVEYIYTDDSNVFHGSHGNEATIAIVPTIVGLVDAATHYQLPKLRSKAEAYVGTMLSWNPLIAIPIMVACQSHGKAVSGMHDLCHKMIRSSPRIFLQAKSTDGNCRLCLLSMTQIEDLLKDGLFEGDELTLFFILKAWTEQDDIATGQGKKIELQEEFSTTPIESRSSTNGRIENARQLAKYIQLEKVDPVELTEFVGNSGLVPMEQLCRAYEAQALMARRKRDIKYNSPRFVNVGGGSSTSISKPTEILGDIVSRSLNFNNLVGSNRNNTVNRSISRSNGVNRSNNNNGTRGALTNPFGYFTLFCPPHSESKHQGSTFFPNFSVVNNVDPGRRGKIEGTSDADYYDSALFGPNSGQSYKEDGELPRPGIRQVDSEVVIFETDDDGDSANDYQSDDGDSHTEAMTDSLAPSPNAPPPVAPPPPPVATTPEKDGSAAPFVSPHT